MPLPTDYQQYALRRRMAMGLPFARSKAYNPAGPTPVVGAGGGTGTTPGTAIPHVGGDTWEMNSNRDGQQFNGPSQWRAGFAGGGDTGERIHGYSGGGLPTNLFSAEMGRAPTAADVEQANGGGLSPNYPQMGSLNSYQDWLRGPSQWQRLQAQPGLPTTPPVAGKRSPFDGAPWAGPDLDHPDVFMAADGGNVPMGQPVIVGERGPEMIVPTKDATVIPNEYLPQQHLINGNILEYLKRFLR